MKVHDTALLAWLATVAFGATPVRAQTAPVVKDLVEDVKVVHDKLRQLAMAMPDSTYDWRPGPGVRSVAEVFKHVASDNWLLPTTTGATPPKETGITGDDRTAGAYEQMKRDRAAILAELDRSFAFLEEAMNATTTVMLTQPVKIFGMESNRQKLWVMATTHLHEHLGQAIAYARTNGVVPPWSR
jgi:uncharacterized damage-inducible protein DinB